MNEQPKTEHGIAIIGMAGRFPKAKNIGEFWRNLCEGVEGVSFFTGEELAAAGVDGPKDNPGYVKARALLEGADLFDAAFFGVNPREAELLDPQHRVFLECAWEALEDAGCDPARFDGAISVFAGMSMNTYLPHNLLTHPEIVAQCNEHQLMLGNDKDFLPTRVSYKLNLRGPSMNIQTACSTSLVAVCVACQNLLNYESDVALAGAVSIMFPQKRGYFFQEGGIGSPDGHCRPFDGKAAGTVPGEGVGIVVLKRVADALADGDTIYAVIKGFATNNDGSNKMGYTAPSVEGQAEVIATAQAMAGFTPETINYIEAHGTATPLGDPVEIEGLTKAFSPGAAGKGFCAIGSVKSNIGHLDTAAGVAGLIKTALALHHKKLPPSLHFESPNPEIDFANSPFYVNEKLAEWKRGETMRRAGVSSFGIGGTNAHVVLEEAAVASESPTSARPAQLLLLSAKTEAALASAAANLAAHLRQNPEINLADAAYTLQVGRQDFAHRRMLVCRTTAGAVSALETSDAKKCLTRASRQEKPPVVFMFPGQGAQEVNMGLELYQHEPVFREQVAACCAMLKPHLGFDLHTVLHPTAGTIEDAKKLLMQTSVTQPALFVIEYALAKLWMSWGVRPDAMIGHSIGEYVAACLAGVFSLEDALQLVAARGRMMQQLPGGTMLAVRLPEQEVKSFLTDKISLAVINSPSLCVISGSAKAIEITRQELAKRGVTSMPLQTSHAFHSAMMDPILESFTELAGKVTLNAPQIPYLSNVTGTWIHPGQATSANYWSKHLRQTVRFAEGLAELYNDQGRILLEIGPGRTLSNLAKQYPAWNANGAAISSLGNKGETITDSENVLGALGQLWLHGVRINWENFYKSEKRRRVHLPAYPFEHRRFWIEPGKSVQKQAISTAPEARPSKREEAIAIPTRQVATAATTPTDQIKETLRLLLAELSGLDPAAMDGETTFTAMGFDSLFLTQASVMIEKKLGVRVGFRHFLEEYSTLNALSAHIAGFLGAGTEKKPAVDENETKATAPVALPQIFSLPLTDAQRELWFASQMSDGASCAYNECQLLDLRGPLKQGALLGSLMKLARRHEALRTVFASDGSLQYVHPAVKLKIPLLDWSKLESDEQSSHLDAVQLEEGSQPFNFVRGPLLRAQLIRLGEEHFLFIVTVHHIICDGHSLGILLRELAQTYSDTCRGARGDLGAPLQLSEYVRRKSEEAAPGADEAFWLKEFAGGAPVLKLPADRPRPATWTFDGAVESRVLPASLGQQLKNLNVRQGGTLFTTLLAGYAILLHKLAGQNEVVIGIPIADRTMAGAETLIGHCVNFLPLRVKIKNETFAEFRAGLQQQFLDAYDHQRFMFSSLIQKLNLPRDTNRMPLVSATINVQRFGESLQFDGLKAEIHANAHASTDFDLAFNLTEINDELLLHCGYHASLFSPETVARWLEHFQTLLESAAADPGQRVSDLSLLAPEDRGKILNDWSGGKASFPGHKCIHQLFEEQVARTPEAMAVVLDEQSLSYAELNRRANRLAHCLRSRGVGPEVMVGLCLERSVEMIISILAVLKAGGAYVPMDPAYPAERLAFVLQDAQAPVLLTQRALLTRFQAHQPGVICVDEFFDSQDSSHDENAGTDARPPNLAYVIYTSGSTGKPKGVQVTHENVTRLFQATQSWYQFNESDVWTLFHSYAFDFSVWEIWGALLYGGRLVVVPHLVSRSPEKFLELLTREKVTVLNQTPSAFRQLVQADQRTLPQPELALRYIIFGGEALELRSLKPWFGRHGDQKPQLVNMYGITETTVHVTYRPINTQDLGSGSVIGQPIPDLQIYILDARLQPVPVGLSGEMYVGGAGVARGYLNRPELTAEKFIPNPFNGKAGDRLYKTGDLARWLANGDIEYLGRGDLQVKIRGHRIELGEIESTLAQHPATRESVVLARVDSPGDERLVAYLVTEPDKASVSLGELRNFLKTKLPEHMIPAAFVFLDALPLTPNGKVDRKALPAPEKVRPELDESFAAPGTPTEIAVAEIWREVLQLERVGLHDNFFELGGHSLLMTQIVSRLREAFQIELPMRRFFESPTIEKLAVVIEELLTEEIRQMSDKEAQNQAQEELTRKI